MRALRFLVAAIVVLARLAASPAHAAAVVVSDMGGNRVSVFADSFGLYTQGLQTPSKPQATDGAARQKGPAAARERNPQPVPQAEKALPSVRPMKTI